MKDRQQVIDHVNQSWIKDLIIRYLYVKLAPFFERDINFFCADEKNKLEYVKTLPQNIGRKIVCLSLCKFYHELFKTFNIESQIITTNKKLIPHYALLVNGDRGWYYIDPLKDLMNNQARIRTQYYGTIPRYLCTSIIQEFSLIELPFEYLDEMDQYLKLILDDILNNHLKNIHEVITTNKAYAYLQSHLHQNSELFDQTEIYKMKLALLNQDFIHRASIPGKIERAQFYSYLLYHIFNHRERKNMIIKCERNVPVIVSVYDSIYTDKKRNMVMN